MFLFYIISILVLMVSIFYWDVLSSRVFFSLHCEPILCYPMLTLHDATKVEMLYLHL